MYRYGMITGRVQVVGSVTEPEPLERQLLASAQAEIFGPSPGIQI
jgi:hypothetical protein